MKELLISLLNIFGLATWVEIDTENPGCTYYFGPFLNEAEANAEKQGYIEDLEDESSAVIQVNVKRCKPSSLTVLEAGKTLVTQRVISHLSTQS